MIVFTKIYNTVCSWNSCLNFSTTLEKLLRVLCFKQIFKSEKYESWALLIDCVSNGVTIVIINHLNCLKVEIVKLADWIVCIIDFIDAISWHKYQISLNVIAECHIWNIFTLFNLNIMIKVCWEHKCGLNYFSPISFHLYVYLNYLDMTNLLLHIEYYKIWFIVWRKERQNSWSFC